MKNATLLFWSVLIADGLSGPSSDVAGQHSHRLPENTLAAFSIIDDHEWRTSFAETDLAKYFDDRQVQLMFGQIFDDRHTENGLISFLLHDSIRKLPTVARTWSWLESGGTIHTLVILELDNTKHAADGTVQIVQFAQSSGHSQRSESGVDAKCYHVESKQGSTPRWSLAVAQQDNRILLGTSLDVVRQILDSDTDSRNLHQNPNFQKVVTARAHELQSNVFWFYVRPLAILHSRSETSPTERKHLQIAEQEGLDAVTAIGGIGKFSPNKNLQVSGQILAQQPLRRGMRLLNLTNAPVRRLPQWTAGACNSGYFNLQTDQLLESVSTLFDTVVGEGESGVFQAVLDDLRNDPQGPQVDLSTEILARLTSPFYFATFANGQDRKTVVGIQVREPTAVAAAIRRCYVGDQRTETIQSLQFPAWRVLPLADNSVGIRTPYIVAVADRYLFVAPDIELLLAALATGEQSAQVVQLDAGNEEIKRRASFVYQFDINALLQLRHDQLRAGQVDGLVGVLMDFLQLHTAIEHSDRASWTRFDDLPSYVESQGIVVGQSDDDGWRFVLELGKFSPTALP